MFLGIDHSFNKEDPILFETMVFDAKGPVIDMVRYKTWEEAKKGHKEMVVKYGRIAKANKIESRFDILDL